jgi:Uma2 family endonuclease
VLRGDLTAHPDRAFLAIEVCHTSGHNDRVIKTRIYGTAGVPEYWIVDVDKEVIEVYRQPRAGGYASKRIVHEGVLHPLHIANARVELAALFA